MINAVNRAPLSEIPGQSSAETQTQKLPLETAIANNPDKIETKDPIKAVQHHFCNKYRQIPEHENVHIPVDIFDRETGHWLREGVNTLPKREYIFDQIQNIHFMYFSTLEKLKTEKYDKFDREEYTNRKQEIQKIMPYDPDSKAYTKEMYERQIEHQLNIQRNKYPQIKAEDVMNKLLGNSKKPIFLTKGEVAALTFVQYRHSNHEVAEGIRQAYPKVTELIRQYLEV